MRIKYKNFFEQPESVDVEAAWTYKPFIGTEHTGVVERLQADVTVLEDKFVRLASVLQRKGLLEASQILHIANIPYMGDAELSEE